MKELAFILLAIIFSAHAVAQDFIVDNLKYKITDNKKHYVSIGQADTRSEGDIVIPSIVKNDGVSYTVTSIRDFAFSHCINLKSVTIPNTIVSIGAFAFNCSGITSIIIPNSVTSIGNHAFVECQKLVSVTISESIKNIGDFTFKNCRELTSVVIPKSVESIGKGAFAYCWKLKSVDIGESVKSIGDGAFGQCVFTIINLPNSIEIIDNSAFSGSDLHSITIPKSVKSIGNDVFSQCFNLTEINVDSQNEYYVSVDGVLFNHDKTNLISYPIGKKDSLYTIPNTVTNISSTAFFRCNSLKSVIIPNSVTNIDDLAFANCGNLSSISIPESVTSIGKCAFISCHKLKTITISKAVTNIGAEAFKYCKGLTAVTIPASVTYVGMLAFCFCDNLTIYCEAEAQPATWDANWNFDSRPVVWGNK